jgi:riboflavin kinase/FMN adenylyltransferase
MELLRNTDELPHVPGPVILAIGVFDGLHLGHESVIQTALKTAEKLRGTALPLTFDPHPARILKPESAPLLLTHTDQKVRLLKRQGLHHALVLPFSQQTAQTAPEDFVRELAIQCRPLRAICVGETWSFGRARRGNLALLQTLGRELQFEAIGVPELQIDGTAVSSTRIRQAVASGDFPTAKKLLGREYTVSGPVSRGRQLGRTLGFPTANIALAHAQLPPLGVYTVFVSREGFPGTQHGIANVGYRPTVDPTSNQPTLEVHLLEFSGDFYGQHWEIQFVDFIRPEMRFSGVDALREQISKDAALASELFAARR